MTLRVSEKLKEIHSKIDAQFSSHLELVKGFLRQPSVSAENEGVLQTAEMVAGMLEQLGTEVELVKTKGVPIVFGNLDLGRKHTIVQYGMYDVQPVGNLADWSHPPFAAETDIVPDYGECIIARGVNNSKGALAGSLLAMKTIREVDELHVNVKFMIEGEEEIGSPNLPRFVKDHAAPLKGDAGVDFDYSQDPTGTPVIHLGLKGIVYFELTARGDETGGPIGRELHSSQAAWISSPTWRLIKALASMVDEFDRPILEGIREKVRPPSEEDYELVRRVAERWDLEACLRECEAKRFKYELPKDQLLVRYMFDPTLNVDGLLSGFVEPGSKTIIPSTATAKVDVRIVPEIEPGDVDEAVRRHLAKIGLSTMELNVLDCYPWSRVSIHERPVQAMVNTYRVHGFEPQIWPYAGWSAPYYVFDRILGIPYVSGGLGQGGRSHAPDEFASVEGMRQFEKSVVTFLYQFSESDQ